MNCPKCKNGVMENLGFVKMNTNQDGNIVFEHSFKRKKGRKAMFICSVDECSHVETTAAPGTLRIAKKIKRRIVFQHYPFSKELPSKSLPQK